MEYLMHLINKECPNGVKYISILDVIDRVRERAKEKAKSIPVYVVSNKMGLVPFEVYRGDDTSAKPSDDTSNYTIVKKGQFAYNPARLNVGSLALMEDDECLISPMYVCFKLKENAELNPRYVLHFLKTSYVFQMIENYKEIGARFRFDYSNWEKIKIPVPPIDIQEKIVEALDSLSRLTEKLNSSLNKEIDFRKLQYGFYKELILSGFEIKQSCKLASICNIKGRIGFRGYTTNDLVAEGEGAISLSPGNIKNGKILFNKNTYLSWEKYYESPEIMLNVGDVVLVKTGSTVGKVAYVESLPEKTTLNPQLVVLKDIKCNPKFLYYWLSSEMSQKYMKENAGLGSVPNISQEKIGNLVIDLPSPEEQERLANILDDINDVFLKISNQSIPSEISFRNRQFDYYRDKLFFFKELKK